MAHTGAVMESKEINTPYFYSYLWEEKKRQKKQVKMIIASALFDVFSLSMSLLISEIIIKTYLVEIRT